MQRNINSLTGCRVEALDGETGKVLEFYFDDDTWTTRYLVLQTEEWLSGRKVLIPPAAVLKDPWKPGIILVNLTREKILKSPEIDTDSPIYRQQEIALYGHYNIPLPAADDLHLRSSCQVTGYHVHGTDGECGHVADFIMDDQSWKMIYLVVDTHNGPGGREVLIAIGKIKQMQWNDSELYVDLTMEEIRQCAVYDDRYRQQASRA